MRPITCLLYQFAYSVPVRRKMSPMRPFMSVTVFDWRKFLLRSFEAKSLALTSFSKIVAALNFSFGLALGLSMTSRQALLITRSLFSLAILGLAGFGGVFSIGCWSAPGIAIGSYSHSVITATVPKLIVR